MSETNHAFSLKRMLGLVLAVVLIGAALTGLSRAAFVTKTIDRFDGVEISGGRLEEGNVFVTTNGDAYMLFSGIGSRVLSLEDRKSVV